MFKDGRTFVAHALDLDVSSCGGSEAKAVKNFKEAERTGTLEQILAEAGYSRSKQRFVPKFVSIQRMSLPLPLTHAKT